MTAGISNLNKLIYTNYDSFEPCKIDVVELMPMENRQMYMFMLLHIEEDLDDDLLFDAL